ncbi:hypothetical protein B5M09_000092 [Aphanomyces astaci]|uniref:E3 UFM1-protein ligase 1-like N-terminal domain-containing protein n=1 Tax=Aphanomyces astaci TaxID=112090 RepID=A0A3R7VZH1_APHAT|nr:hypothetical protein B5M09_000092 [Aphanomyces astaci]
MNEIHALQRELAAAQETKEAIRLSERNIIDLLFKLQALNMVELIFTTNAKAVLTPAQLRKEILDQVQSHSGRVSLHELYTSTNVDMGYIEKYAREIVDQPNPTDKVHWVGNDLISDAYLDTIMTSVHNTLQDTGSVSIGDLALQYGVPVEFTHQVVQARLDSILENVRMKGTVLYTPEYASAQLERVRDVAGALILASSSDVDGRFVADCLSDLIASNAVRGHLRGREFVPTAFLDTQRAAVDAFFTSNNYLPHAMTTQLQVTGRPVDFVKKQFPDCVDLEDVVVSGALLLHVEGAVEGLLHDPTWLDVRSELPSAIDAQNATLLLAKALERVNAPSVVQIGGLFAVHAAMMSQAMEKFQGVAKSRASQAAYVALESGGSEAKTSTTKSTSGQQAKKQNKTTRGTICPAHDEQRDLVMAWFDHCVDEDEFVAALLESLHDAIESCFATALTKAEATIYRGDSYQRRELTELFEAGFDDKLGHLVVSQKALHKLAIKATSASDTTTGLDVIERSVLRSSGVQLCAWVLQYVNEHHQVELDDVGSILDASQPVMTGLTPSQENVLKKRVTFAPTVVRMWQLADGGSSLPDFIQHLTQVSTALGIPSRKFDRKKEKAIVAAFKHRLLLDGSLTDDESDFNGVLRVVCSLVFYAATSLALPLAALTASEIQTVYPVLRHSFLASAVAADTIALTDDLHTAATELQLLAENPDLLSRALVLLQQAR